MNYSFLILLCHVLITPLSKAAKSEPIGSNTENYSEVIAFCDLEKFSALPTMTFGLPFGSFLIDPKKMLPVEEPKAKLIPFGLNIADVIISFASNFSVY